MAGGSGRGHAHSIPAPPPDRAHVYVRGPEGGLHPGLLVSWERRGESWWAQTAYVPEDGALVVQWLPADDLTPLTRPTLSR